VFSGLLQSVLGFTLVPTDMVLNSRRRNKACLEETLEETCRTAL